MGSIVRLQTDFQKENGLSEWGERLLIPTSLDDQMIETNQIIPSGSIDVSKIKNLVLDTLTITTGGYIRSGKTSFTDTTNAGWFFGPDGIYVGSASDASKLLYKISDGSFEFIGTVSGRSTATIASTINSSGNVITDIVNARFDTSAKNILASFAFGASGALQIGSYVNGVTGDVKISPAGIIGRNSSGSNTFSIDGTTGVATFAGALSAPSGTLGGFTLGSTTITSTGLALTSGTSASLAFGVTPPTSPTVGTGIYIDKTGLFGLNANTQNFKIDATNGNITATGAVIDGTSTLGGRTGTALAAAINASNNLVTDIINARLDSSTKKMLSDFTFGTADYAGALKSGTITWNTTTGALTGGDGVLVYRGGIIGAAAGVATFTLNASTGAATFAGALSAPTGTIGGFTINATTLANSTNIILDSSNKSISINDATFGNSGIQLQYNAGTPRIYSGNGSEQYFKFDGTNVVVNNSGLSFQDAFGDGSDGDVVISGDTTLTTDMYYNNLTVNNTKTLNSGSYRIFVKGILINNGTISNKGNAGGNGSNASGSTGGNGGTAGTAVSAGFFVGGSAGKTGIGGIGSVSNGTPTTGANGTNVTSESMGVSGVAGVAGGSGGTNGGSDGVTTFGTAGTATPPTNKIRSLTELVVFRDFTPSSPTKLDGSAGSGGSGGGGAGHAITAASHQGSGGGGGGSGSSGGILMICASKIINGGTITAAGGDGGLGGNGSASNTDAAANGGGGGGSGSGGPGGVMVLAYKILSNSGTVTVAGGSRGATAGTGGAGGGNSNTHGADGSLGNTGTTGTLMQIPI